MRTALVAKLFFFGRILVGREGLVLLRRESLCRAQGGQSFEWESNRDPICDCFLASLVPEPMRPCHLFASVMILAGNPSSQGSRESE